MATKKTVRGIAAAHAAHRKSKSRSAHAGAIGQAIAAAMEAAKKAKTKAKKVAKRAAKAEKKLATAKRKAKAKAKAHAKTHPFKPKATRSKKRVGKKKFATKLQLGRMKAVAKCPAGTELITTGVAKKDKAGRKHVILYGRCVAT